MRSLLTTSAPIGFEVLRRAGHNYSGCTHIGHSIWNIRVTANRKTQLQFENIYQGWGWGAPFLD